MRTKALFNDMQALYITHKEPDLIDAVPSFPFKQMYRGQYEVYNEIGSAFQEIAITSHTGSGKTALYLSLIPKGVATIVISPRKFLQKQVAAYKNSFTLFGRSEYPCIIDPSKKASNAPCNAKVVCEAQSNVECTKRSQDCNTGHCKVFQHGSKKFPFPCPKCSYLKAQQEAKQILKAGGIVVCNFGNFWQLLKHSKLVVIDEADLFFREISKPTLLHYSSVKKNSGESIDSLLQREATELQKAVETSPPEKVYSVKNMLYNAQFLKDNASLCFQYQRKGRGGDKIYVEVNPANVKILKDKIFKGKQLIIVSATLGNFDIPRYSYSVFQRRGIFYAPVGKLTSRELKTKPFILNRASEAIETISSIAEGMFDTDKFPVHCGNIGTHATILNDLLGADRHHLYCRICGEKIEDISAEEQEVQCPKCKRKWKVGDERCTMHIRGNLMKTIDDFKDNRMRYLLVAGADYGGDMTFAKLQFVLKYPYPSLDDRMRTLEKLLGKADFNAYYSTDARSRFVQSCGRTCRGAGDFGVTVVLDSKFIEEWHSNADKFPDWFRDSFNGKVY